MTDLSDRSLNLVSGISVVRSEPFSINATVFVGNGSKAKQAIFHLSIACSFTVWQHVTSYEPESLLMNNLIQRSKCLPRHMDIFLVNLESMHCHQ